MKKLLLLIVIFAFGCSNSDDDNGPAEDNRPYSAHMKRYCPNPPVGENNYIYDICISKETYEELQALRASTSNTSSCLTVTFTALDGTTVINDYLVRVDRGVTDCLYPN